MLQIVDRRLVHLLLFVDSPGDGRLTADVPVGPRRGRLAVVGDVLLALVDVAVPLNRHRSSRHALRSAEDEDANDGHDRDADADPHRQLNLLAALLALALESASVLARVAPLGGRDRGTTRT